MRHDTGAVGRNLDQRATTSSVHVEGAFLSPDPEPSASSESPIGKAPSIIYTPAADVILKSQG
jgi:hypothetical protein